MILSASLVFTAGLLAAPAWDEAVGPRDYPQVALQNDWSAAVMMDLVVDPSGKVIDCKAITGFGNQDFAAMFCAMTSRGKLEPARDSEGRPVYGFRRDVIKLYLPDTSEGRRIRDLPNPIPPDIEIEVAQLPGVSDPFLDVAVAVAVDAEGRVTECQTGEEERHQAFANVACQQMLGANLGVVNDKNGSPVGYVRGVRARFKIAASHSQG